MLNSLYCEFLKLKKSYFYLILIIFIGFFPGILCFGWLVQGKAVTWNYYINQVEQMAYLITHLAMFSMVGGYIFTREFSCNTAQTLFSYPIGRVKIFVSKFIVTAIFTGGAAILMIVFTILGGLLLPHEPLTKTIIYEHMKINFNATALEFAILPLAIFVALLSRNVIMPIVYGGLATVANMAILGSGIEKLFKYVPTLFPVTYMINSFNKHNGVLEFVSGNKISNISVFIAAATFVIGITMCIVYYINADID